MSWQSNQVTTLGAASMAANAALKYLTHKKTHHLTEHDVTDIESLVRNSFGEYAIQFFPHFSKKSSQSRQIIVYPILSTNRITISNDRPIADALNLWLAGAENYLAKRSILRMKWAKNKDKHSGIIQGLINYVVVHAPIWCHLLLENKITLDAVDKKNDHNNPLADIKRFFLTLLNDAHHKEKLYVIADLEHIFTQTIRPRIKRKLSQQNCTHRLEMISNHLENIWRDLFSLVVFLSDENIARINPDLRLIIPEQIQNNVVHARLGEARGIKTVLNFFSATNHHNGDYLINELRLNNHWAKKIKKTADICLTSSVDVFNFSINEPNETQTNFESFHPILKQQLILKKQKSRNFNLSPILNEQDKLNQIKRFDALFPFIIELSQLGKTIQYLKLLTGWVGDKNIYTILEPMLNEVISVAIPVTCDPLLHLLDDKEFLGKLRLISENAYLNQPLRQLIGIRTQENVIGECLNSIESNLSQLNTQVAQVNWQKNQVGCLESDIQKIELKLMESLLRLRRNQLIRQKIPHVDKTIKALEKKMTGVLNNFHKSPLLSKNNAKTKKQINEFLSIIDEIKNAFINDNISQTHLLKSAKKLFFNTSIDIFPSIGRIDHNVYDLCILNNLNKTATHLEQRKQIIHYQKQWKSMNIILSPTNIQGILYELNRNIKRLQLTSNSMVNLKMITPEFQLKLNTIQFLKKVTHRLQKTINALLDGIDKENDFFIYTALIDKFLGTLANIANTTQYNNTNFINELSRFCNRCNIQLTMKKMTNATSNIHLSVNYKTPQVFQTLARGITNELNDKSSDFINYYIHWIGEKRTYQLFSTLIETAKKIINNASDEKNLSCENLIKYDIHKKQNHVSNNNQIEKSTCHNSKVSTPQSEKTSVKKINALKFFLLISSLAKLSAGVYYGVNKKYILSFSFITFGTITFLAIIFSYTMKNPIKNKPFEKYALNQ
jgi:hypothetical protein